jgi:hypothetical protein
MPSRFRSEADQDSGTMVITIPGDAESKSDAIPEERSASRNRS